jgi:hypothetical protein
MSESKAAGIPYVCPQCGGGILNRAYPKCERCQATLPAVLVFSKIEANRRWDSFAAQRLRESDAKLRAIVFPAQHNPRIPL